MSDQEHMDIRPQQEMWAHFTQLMTWSTVSVVVILALMAIFLV